MALESKHYVTRGFNQSRSLEIAPKFYDEQKQHRQQPASFELPLLGRIAAGAPVEAIAGRDTLNFSDFAGNPGTYALQVRGESMIEDHICDGDYVLVENATEARDGDIVVFSGVFVTMVPALAFLEERGAALGITRPWQFFWSAGALSSVLDNAPTYLTFASLASGVVHTGGDLGALAAHPTGQRLLAAVASGAVFMGALTYIGNGPNFMVKAIAEQHHVRMPSFFGYTLWSLAILVPLFAVVAVVFF
jgi:hypothetical protein